MVIWSSRTISCENQKKKLQRGRKTGSITFRVTPSTAEEKDGVVNLQNVSNSESEALFISIMISLIWRLFNQPTKRRDVWRKCVCALWSRREQNKSLPIRILGCHMMEFKEWHHILISQRLQQMVLLSVDDIHCITKQHVHFQSGVSAGPCLTAMKLCCGLLPPPTGHVKKEENFFCGL